MTPKTCIHEPWEKCPCAHVASLGGAAAVRMGPSIPAGLPADLRRPRPDVLPSVPHVEVRLNEGGATYRIVDERGEVVSDPVEGLPLDGIRTRAAADRIVSRLRAF
jgi:hypothetical protein